MTQGSEMLQKFKLFDDPHEPRVARDSDTVGPTALGK